MTFWSATLVQGLRSVRTRPAGHAAAVATLTAGICAALTMFAIVDAVVLRPLPYPDAARLAFVWDREGDSTRDIWLSPPEVADLTERGRAFDGVAALTDHRFAATGHGAPEEWQGVAVSPNLFTLLGATPVAGRTLAPGDDRGNTHPAVLSEDVATRIFGSPAAAIGQPLTLDAAGWTVVGVLPRRFGIWPPSSVFPRHVDVWVPIGADLYARAARTQHFFHALVRLAPGVSFDQAAADLSAVAATIVRDHPADYTGAFRMRIVPIGDQAVAAARPAVWLLFGAVGLLLLVACANAAGIILARAGGRRREIAVRAALGASAARLAAQAIVETSGVAIAATVAGALIAEWLIAAIAAFGPADVPRLSEARIDGAVLAFAAAIALVTTVLCGLAPALHWARADVAEGLRDGARSTDGARVTVLRRALVAAQLSAAVVLVTMAGVVVQAFVQLARVDPGFVSRSVVTGRVTLPVSRYPEPRKRSALFEQVIDRLQARPEIEAAGGVTQLPMSGAFLGSSFAQPAGEAAGTAPAEFGADLRGVSGAYFGTLGIRLLAGRTFAPNDDADAAPVAIVDETLARGRWGSPSAAIGKHLVWTRTQQTLEVVGVVSAVRHYGAASPARETVYRPYRQYGFIPQMFVAVRARSSVEAARNAIAEEVHRADATQPVADLQPLDRNVEASLGQPRFTTVVMASFAAVVLLLAAAGVFAVLALTVAERRRELAVRMALGARRGEIRRLVLADGLRLAAVGAAAGVILAVIAMRLTARVVVGVGAWSPWIAIGAVGLLLVVAAAASDIPARRAATVDPAEALRQA